jgi:hypothetical protein
MLLNIFFTYVLSVLFVYGVLRLLMLVPGSEEVLNSELDKLVNEQEVGTRVHTLFSMMRTNNNNYLVFISVFWAPVAIAAIVEQFMKMK